MIIDKKILDKTSCCEKNLGCLKNDNHKCCKVENCVNNEVHFVDCLDNKNCNYKKSFGYSNTCTCPTRKEIYNVYGL